VADVDAVVTERIQEPTLRSLMSPTRRLRRRPRDLAPAFGHVGGWLRCYQAIEGASHSETRHENRESFIEAIHLLSAYAGQASSAPVSWLAPVSERLVRVAERELPLELPLGIAHGDLAPRNILVADSNRVTVLDTRAAWRAPVLEDVGYLLASLWTSRAQALGFGLGQSEQALARYERAFLDGYFGDGPRSLTAIRLFEIQALLDRYAAVEERRRGPRGASPIRAIGHRAVERCLRRRILRLAGQLPGGRSA